jgi:acyl phosphate:glycerol-3-phosphate acyltransferase
MDIYISMLAICLAYLLGSLSSAIIVCRLMHLADPRTEGSLNPGATNVLRIGGKKAAILTLVGDMLKGFLPVYLAKILELDTLSIAFIAFAAFIGHLYPIFFRFEGGKGVATALGALIALSPLAFACWLMTFGIVFFSFHFVSLASLVAALLAPFYLYFFTKDVSLTISMSLMSCLLVLRHRSNIEKLCKGQEHSFKLSRK